MEKKKNIQKTVCLLLAALCLLIFVGCGDPSSEPTREELCFRVGNTEIRLNTQAAPVLQALGEARECSESPSCAFEGLDRIYIYSGFRIQTYEADGTEYLYSVEIVDDSVSTPEGITIGASKDDVIAKYCAGTPPYRTEEENGRILCISNDGAYTLQFLLRNEKVTNIQYTVDTALAKRT